MGEALPPLARGEDILREVLAQAPVPVRELPRPAFAAWLRALVADASTDPAFAYRRAVADLERLHHRELSAARQRLEQAREALRQSASGAAVAEAQEAADRARKGAAGLAQAVEEGRASPAKRDAFVAQAAEAERRLEAAIAASPEYRALQAAEQALGELERSVGLTAAQDRLAALQRASGQARTRLGDAFEDVARRIVEQVVVPEVGDGGPLTVLSAVTLGCARGELDHVVVDVRGEQDPVVVLAVVEAKRNLDDLGHGFVRRQENLAWFTSAPTGWSAEDYRNRHYPEGRFDRPMAHVEHGRRFVFDPTSFAALRPEPLGGALLDGLWFVSERRPLTGLGTKDHQRLVHRLATDPWLDLDDPQRVEGLREWVQAHTSEVQATDVLERYLDADRAAQIVLTERRRPPASRR